MRIETQARQKPFRRRFECESEHLMPPCTPPPAKALFEDSIEGAEVGRVHPWFAANTEDGGSEDANEEDGAKCEDEFESVAYRCQADAEADGSD